jgi:uncharacterized YceG family protein
MTLKKYKFGMICIFAIMVLLLATPFLFSAYSKIKYSKPPTLTNQFPITVDPVNKTIKEDEKVEEYFNSPNFNIQAQALTSTGKFEDVFSKIAVFVSEIVGSDNLALATGQRVVTVHSGFRKEEIAKSFSRALSWDDKEKKEFLSKQEGQDLPLVEGSFFPGVYVVSANATPQEVQDIINQRFTSNVLSRYGTSTAEVVSLDTALTVASLIQRETIGTDDMRMVSGIIWNRIFTDMNLQLDATLQYVKANQNKNEVWWPQVTPRDKYIKSPYNTYIHSGLPPAPIANPSVAAIMAALNPAKTDCLFYFHDKDGEFHCSTTYKEHVALLKKYYGRGK